MWARYPLFGLFAGAAPLTALLFAFGTLALAGDAAHQSFLQPLVPRPLLTRANARLGQGTSVDQTAGGTLAGGLAAALGARWRPLPTPWAISSRPPY